MENKLLGTPMSASDQTGAIGAKKAGLGLGYFSIALGLLEVAAPGRLARWLGVENETARKTILAFGARELLAGGALLRGPAVSTNVWNRVLGDLIDAGALGLAARSSTRKRSLAFAGGVVAGALVADVLTATTLDRTTARTFSRRKRQDDAAHEPEFTPEPHDLAAA